MNGIASTDGIRQLQASIERLDADFAERSVDVGGSVLSYRSGGAEAAEKTVVLLHGIGSGAASWLHSALALENDARVIAWNAPGYGASSPLPMARPSAADYAARLEQFLRAMAIDNCILVGHSLGAMMVSAYMARGSGRVAQSLLISPAQGYGSDDKCVRGREIERQRLAALDDPGIDGMARKSPERMLSPQAGQLARDWVRWNTQKLHPAGYTQAVYMLCGDDIQPYLSAAAGLPAAPVMAVYCGADDIVTTPQESRALAEVFQLPFHLIEAAGHACHIEQPQAVAAVIRRHLDQLS